MLIFSIRCGHLLKSYPTTLSQDEELSKGENLSQKLRDCLVLRMKEKEKLNLTIKFCQNKLDELNKKD